MEKSTGTITTIQGETEVTEHLFTYSEEEKQTNAINAANASLVFSPKFIPFYPSVQTRFGLTNTETLIFGFIDFYKSSSNTRFYFTNEQIGKIISCNEDTVSRAISKLEKCNLIKTSKKVRAGGGTIRFVTDILSISEPTFPTSPTRQNLQANNNKINNKIYTNVYTQGGGEDVEKIKGYGNPAVNRILAEFTKLTGLSKPIDKDPRFWAWQFVRNKKMGVEHFTPCLRYLLKKWDGRVEIAKLELVYRHYPEYERDVVEKAKTRAFSKTEFAEDGTIIISE